MPYLALEAWAWLSYRKERSRGHRLEREYRDLAWQVARRIDAPLRRDSVFAYYEAMAEFHESGAFDADPATAGVQPERDTLTYNGQQWKRAQDLYAQYGNALSYYLRHAIPPGFRWSWGEGNLEQQVFRQLIDESDDALRRASRTLGLILANHVVSAIDALVTARVEAAATSGHRLRIESELAPIGRTLQWTSTIRLQLGN